MQPVSAAESAIRFRGVVKKYGAKTALNGLDLDIPKGSIFGLIGANGAGKTTFMSIATGLVLRDSGEINLLGGGSYDARIHKGRVTLLPQDSLPPPYAHPASLLRYYARLQGMNAKQAKQAALDVLQWVNLSDRASTPIRALSHGMKRRFSIAQAFLGHPDLVILDEPMNGLDPVQVAALRSLILSRRGKQTILISSHILPDLQHLCDHVAILHEGRVIRQGKIAEITGSSVRVDFTLTAEPPLLSLQNDEPTWTFTWIQESGTLRVETPLSLDPATVNARIFNLLGHYGCRVLEIARGTSLEQAYLSAF